MTKERKEILFAHLLQHVYECNPEPEDYATTLKYIGFTKEEVFDELVYNCGFDVDDMMEIVDEIWRWL